MTRFSVVISAFAMLTAASAPASATGALAFGSTGDVAKDGYSIGINSNSANEEDARKGAMGWCTSHGPKQTQAQYEILVVFHSQCAAEAQDPKPGTPGFGFAVADTEEDAKKMAMAVCLASAGKGRRDFCKVVTTLCDKN